MANSIILSREIKDFKPVEWQGQPVFARYKQIINYIKQELGDSYCKIFAQPHITDSALNGFSKAKWSSSYFSSNAKVLTLLPESEQKAYLSYLNKRLDAIIDLSDRLLGSTNKQDKYWGEVLRLIVKYPGNEAILIENEEVVIAIWGFVHKNDDFDSGSIKQGHERPPKREHDIINPGRNKDQIKEDNQDENQKPEVRENVEKVDLPERIVPINPDEIIKDESGRTIVGNRLNIILSGENKSIEQFARVFKKNYPGDNYKITYCSEQTFRLQIEFPSVRRTDLKKELPEVLSEFEMIIIPESIFKSNSNDVSQAKKKWHHEMIGLSEAWETTKGSDNVVVAVVDDGFDLDHPLFENRVVHQRNICENSDKLFSVADGHGTHVAGIAIGALEGNEGIGIAPDCKFIPIQVADRNGCITTTAVIDGILYAFNNKADVVNISLGGKMSDEFQSLSIETQEDFIKNSFKEEEYFWDEIFSIGFNKNIAVVLAAGNENVVIGCDPMQRSDKTIKVSAVDVHGNKATFSNFGELSTLSAPGVRIYSSLPGKTFGELDGTSMAAPIVAGAVALIKSNNTSLSSTDIVKQFQKTGITVDSPERYVGNIIQLGKTVKETAAGGGISNDVDERPGEENSSNDHTSTGESNLDDNTNNSSSGNSNFDDNKNDNGRNRKKSNRFLGFFGGRKGCLTSLLLFLLLLLLIFLLFRYCSNPAPVLPPEPGIIPPIDTTKIIQDPDTVRNIISDRLNIVLKGENKDIPEFAKLFKKRYPDQQFKVVYYNALTCRIQIQIPQDEREKVKNELPDKMPEFEMLIWDESLYKNDYVPGDPGFSDNKQQWYFKKVKAFDVWDNTKGDTNIVIAVIDNGFDISHPEIRGKVVRPYNVITQNADVSIPKYHKGNYHGTHVAATATGWANNQEGVSGIAPNCRLMPIRVADDNGNMSNTAIIDAVLYAINNKADVVNMSLGLAFNDALHLFPSRQKDIIDHKFKQEEEFWKEVFQMAEEENIVFVLAAGNADMLIGMDPMQRSNNTIIVSAVDPNDQKASFSNYGTGSTISAPGVQIYNALPDDSYGYLDGTSMAAPIVTGGIALLKTLNPIMQYEEICDLIQSTGMPVTNNGKYVGNIIQLETVAGSAKRQRQKQPRVDCPNVQRQIDSLLLEIEKLKKTCKNDSQDTLKIPDSPSDMSFAIGKWKSTTEIRSLARKEEIDLYFDIFGGGKGEITLVHKDGTKCTAPLSVSMSNGTISMDQTTAANCESGDTYNPYLFRCTADKNGNAKCWTENKTDAKNSFQFNLIRIK